MLDSGHLAFPCSSHGCDQLFVTQTERDAHQKRPHTTGHGRATTPTPFDCVECDISLHSKAALLYHAKEKQHQPYACECGSRFSRLDVLNRHLQSVGVGGPQYPCRYCRRYRGSNGFRRRDHLTQHIRNYHHLEINDDYEGFSTFRRQLDFPICSHPDCPQYRDESFNTLPRTSQAATKPFDSRAAYTKHLREEHNECTFPCDVQGCDRIGRRGYFREKDLIKHRRDLHPDASPYQPAEQEVKRKCPEPGCGAVLVPSSMAKHAKYKHFYGNEEKKKWD